MSTPPLNTLIVTFYVHEEDEDNEDALWRASGVRASLKLMMRIHEAVELSTGRYVVKTTMTAEELYNSLQILIDKSQDKLEIKWMD